MNFVGMLLSHLVFWLVIVSTFGKTISFFDTMYNFFGRWLIDPKLKTLKIRPTNITYEHKKTTQVLAIDDFGKSFAYFKVTSDELLTILKNDKRCLLREGRSYKTLFEGSLSAPLEADRAVLLLMLKKYNDYINQCYGPTAQNFYHFDTMNKHTIMVIRKKFMIRAYSIRCEDRKSYGYFQDYADLFKQLIADLKEIFRNLEAKNLNPRYKIPRDFLIEIVKIINTTQEFRLASFDTRNLTDIGFLATLNFNDFYDDAESKFAIIPNSGMKLVGFVKGQIFLLILIKMFD